MFKAKVENPGGFIHNEIIAGTLATIKNYGKLPNWELFTIFALLNNKM